LLVANGDIAIVVGIVTKVQLFCLTISYFY